MSSNRVKQFRDLVLFTLKQLGIYMVSRNNEYIHNTELQKNKPIVFKENLAVYEEELLYLTHTKERIAKYDISHFTTPEEFTEFILADVGKYYKENGIPHVCYVILEEKLHLCVDFFNNAVKE